MASIASFDGALAQAKELLAQEHIMGAAELLLGLEEADQAKIQDAELLKCMEQGRQLLGVVDSLKSREGETKTKTRLTETAWLRGACS